MTLDEMLLHDAELERENARLRAELAAAIRDKLNTSAKLSDALEREDKLRALCAERPTESEFTWPKLMTWILRIDAAGRGEGWLLRRWPKPRGRLRSSALNSYYSGKYISAFIYLRAGRGEG